MTLRTVKYESYIHKLVVSHKVLMADEQVKLLRIENVSWNIVKSWSYSFLLHSQTPCVNTLFKILNPSRFTTEDDRKMFNRKNRRKV